VAPVRVRSGPSAPSSSGSLVHSLVPVRIEANLTQAEIAERAGVSHATISRMETAKTWPSGRNVESVIDAYATASGLSQLEFLERIVLRWRENERASASGRHD
jgi:hypothetical protein